LRKAKNHAIVKHRAFSALGHSSTLKNPTNEEQTMPAKSNHLFMLYKEFEPAIIQEAMAIFPKLKVFQIPDFNRICRHDLRAAGASDKLVSDLSVLLAGRFNIYLKEQSLTGQEAIAVIAPLASGGQEQAPDSAVLIIPDAVGRSAELQTLLDKGVRIPGAPPRMPNKSPFAGIKL
jgi:hypothetical protein